MGFMKLPLHKLGYCWSNVAPLGEKPQWVEIVAPWNSLPRESELFGYDEKAFLRKQYK